MSENENPEITASRWWRGLSVLGPVSSVTAALASAWFAFQANQTSESVQHLTLEPDVRLSVRFPNADGRPKAHFIIDNIGPVDAVQVEFRLEVGRYVDKSNDDKLMMNTGTEGNWRFPRIAAFSQKVQPFDERIAISSSVSAPEIPAERHFLQAVVSYRRDVDRKMFAARAFYFLLPDGRWVSPGNNELTAEYDWIRKVAPTTKPFSPPGSGLLYDELHPIDVEAEFERW